MASGNISSLALLWFRNNQHIRCFTLKRQYVEKPSDHDMMHTKKMNHKPTFKRHGLKWGNEKWGAPDGLHILCTWQWSRRDGRYFCSLMCWCYYVYRSWCGLIQAAIRHWAHLQNSLFDWNKSITSGVTIHHVHGSVHTYFILFYSFLGGGGLVAE